MRIELVLASTKSPDLSGERFDFGHGTKLQEERLRVLLREVDPLDLQFDWLAR